MNRVGRLIATAGGEVAGAAATVALWLFWGLLVLLAAGQVYVATHNDVSVPGFVLRGLESRLKENGLRVTFQGATFDPTGRILLAAPRVFVPEFDEPVMTARAAYIGLNPWALVVGSLQMREVQLVEGTVMIPAMLSPSGKAQPMVAGVDALLLPGQRTLTIQSASGRVGALFVSVRGTVTRMRPLKPAEHAPAKALRYSDICRTAVSVMERIEAFDEPALDLTLEPSPAAGAIVSADLVARGFQLDAPMKVQVGPLRVRTRFALLGAGAAVSPVQVQCDDVQLPGGIDVRGVTGTVTGEWHPAERWFAPGKVEMVANSVVTPEGDAAALSISGHPETPKHWDADMVGRVLGSVLHVSGDADLAARTARVRFAGSISPQVLDVVNRHVRVDIRKFFNFAALECSTGSAELGPDWKFRRLAAHVALRGIDAYGVPMDEGAAVLEVDPFRLYAPEAYARIGPNFARGTYEQVFATRQFRFLLDGRLRPMDIAKWFHPWWANFFDKFEFPVAPPVASVDVQGIWRDGRQTSVFVFADAASPNVFGRPLSRVRTRVFVRPGFYDDLELFGTDPKGGEAHGTFKVVTDLDADKWRSVDVDADSTVPLETVQAIGGKVVEPYLSPFQLANRPTVKFQLHLDGPDIGPVRHDTMDLVAHSKGGFKYDGLPLEDVAFTTTMRNDVLTIDSTEGKFAGGAVRLHAQVTGRAPDRRLAFDASVTNASLGVAVDALRDYSAERKGQRPPPPGKFVQEKANVRIDLTAAAQGKYGDPLSFHGAGKTALRGAEIGEVPLFGPLSDLLKFTALRFTSAHGTFRINGPKLEFPDVAVRGANSAIDAHGNYALDRGQLDFRAKVFPFQESGSVLKSVVGAVLTPISNALEVKLTGTLDKPDWAFVIGPTNLLRSLAGPAPSSTSPTPTTANPPPGAPAATRTPPPAAPQGTDEKPATGTPAAPTATPGQAPRPGPAEGTPGESPAQPAPAPPAAKSTVPAPNGG